jgi:hypothetical protein
MLHPMQQRAAAAHNLPGKPAGDGTDHEKGGPL